MNIESTKICKWCNGKFIPNRSDQKFGRDICRFAYHNDINKKSKSKIDNDREKTKLNNLEIINNLVTDIETIVKIETLESNNFDFHFIDSRELVPLSKDKYQLKIGQFTLRWYSNDEFKIIIHANKIEKNGIL